MKNYKFYSQTKREIALRRKWKVCKRCWANYTDDIGHKCTEDMLLNRKVQDELAEKRKRGENT